MSDGPLELLADRIDSILSFEEFSRDLAAGLGLIRPEQPDAELDAFVARVKGRFESSRNYGVILQFLQDHSRLTDRQLVRLFEFIYSKLVNKFKGEIGEVLAARTVFEFRSQLGNDIDVLHGSWLSERRLIGSRGWYDGADALYCRREDDRLDVVAIAEVKSKATSVDDMATQVARNIVRLRRGLRLRGEEIGPERITITAGNRTVAAIDVDEEHARAVTALFIVPWRNAVDGVPVRDSDRGNVWLAELPYSQDEITEAAYRFMSWYFSGVGPNVFYYLRDGEPPPGDPRVPAPHQELSLEENGAHAFMEAIYHSALRKTFDAHEVAVPGRRTAWQTLLWLYNSLGFSYEKATTDELMFPEFTPNPDHEAWLIRHNAAMAEYRAGRIAAALEIFPDPALQTYGDWAPREWMALARLHARNGDVTSAREALRHFGGDAAHHPSLSTRMEFAAVEALIAFAGFPDETEAKLRHATEVISSIRDLVTEHEKRGWGFPANLTPANARAAVIDLAVAYTLADDRETAVDLLLRLRGLEPHDIDLVANDPVLSTIATDALLTKLRDEGTKRPTLAIF